MDKISFEEAFKELEEIVHRLEEGELTLEETIALFERGKALARYCGDVLDKAELKVKKLTSEGYETAPFTDLEF